MCAGDRGALTARGPANRRMGRAGEKSSATVASAVDRTCHHTAYYQSLVSDIWRMVVRHAMHAQSVRAVFRCGP
ncbi:hypothetical protein JOE11_004067 [Robbsia andropogonis]